MFERAGGAMAALMAGHDWAATPLGPPSGWPPSLKTLVGVMLASTQPMFMAWGPGQVWLYNDAFVPILGRKHPAALGQPALQVWGEAREALQPLFDRVFSGEAVHMEDFSLMLDRHGRLEEAHFAFSYTPARDEQGEVAGLFGACIETTRQVLADRRQAAAQERQRRLFQQAPGFIAILHGPQHIFEFVNDAYTRLVGHRDLIGRSVRDAFPDVAGQGFFELLDQVYATGRRYIAAQVPVRFRGADAVPDEHYLDFIYEPILDETGRVEGIFVEGHDVTEACQAQAELRANERRQALLVELDDRFRDLSEPADLSFAAAELLGRSLGVSRAGYGTIDPVAETVVIERDWNAPGIRSLAGVLHLRDYGSYIEDLKRGETVVFADAEQDPRTQANAAALKAISAQSVVNMPVTEQRGLVALLYLNHAAPRTWSTEELGFIRQVAERTRTAVARRRAEKDLLALTASLERQVAERTAERDRVWQNSRDLLVVVGADGILRAVNPAWTAILGHEPHEVVGRSFLEFVWPEDAVRTQGGLDEAAHDSDLTDFENRYRHRDGTPRWISWHTAAEGELVFAYGRDVTAQKAQARALQQAEEALRQSQKLEAMGQLTGGVAHDFNNLLAVVSNNLYLHRRLSPACHDSPQLAAIARATETGARLTRQLLAFARRQAIRPEAILLQRELPELREVLQATLGGQVEMRLEVAPDTPALKADRSELELAIINLAMNSRDAMPEGGVLSIRVRPVAGAATDGPGLIAIEVADTGHGIAPELLSRVFEPFFTTKEPGRGTGLGLSQVYGFASQAGGRLEIASEPGVSTTVTLLLPATGEAVAAPPAARTGHAARLQASILLVEDNPEVGTTTRELLEAAGCAVLHLGNGEQARAHLLSPQGRGVDLVLSDLVMPGPVSGVALARWVGESRPGLPVLLATGYSREMAVATEQGYTVLQKPVTPQALIDAVRTALRR
ncbi:PAS domain-containing protein [Eleftheria terrae]|uniref:PAS domain-containing protein n=1 Tax=Eleftheria terrae TaxID=1597781 RepID=UPI00263BD456|nr:PAS domain-containing protein [Eleftheria terrae]WKB55465.1 PAS domain-containing protein [Eleftheria terrae]